MERRIAEIPASEWDDLSDRPDAARDRHRVPGPRLSGAVAGTVLGRRRQPVHEPARVRCRRQSRCCARRRSPEARCADREARGIAARAVGIGPDRAPFRARSRRRGHRAVAPGPEARGRPFDKLRAGSARTPGAALAAGFRQPRRDRRLHGRRASASSSSPWPAGTGPQLPRRSVLRQYRAPGPLPAGTGLEGRPGDPGTRAAPTGRTKRPRHYSVPLPPM